MNIDELLGNVVIKIDKSDDELIFYCLNGDIYKQYHHQDGGGEEVKIDDITGDLDDLLNSEILIAEERTVKNEDEPTPTTSKTWTFYNLATIKGYVTIRWFGESNGYYSEEVDFIKIS